MHRCTHNFVRCVSISCVCRCFSIQSAKNCNSINLLHLIKNPFSCGARAIIDVLVLLLLLLSFVTIHSHYISSFFFSFALARLTLMLWMLLDVYVSKDFAMFRFFFSSAGHSLRLLFAYTFKKKKTAAAPPASSFHSTNVLFFRQHLFVVFFFSFRSFVDLFYISFPIVSPSKLSRADLAPLFYTLHH